MTSLPLDPAALRAAALTLADIAVAAGRADIGDRSLVAGLSRELVTAALDRIASDVADVVDRMRISADPLPVVDVVAALLGLRLR